MHDTISSPPEAPAARGTRRATQLPLALVTALLGFLLATQFQARESLKTQLAGEREEDLAQILANLSTSSDQIQDEIVSLRVRLETARGSADQEQALLEGARQQLDSLRILLGLAAVHGPGLVATITDPDGTVGPEVLLDAVEELRDAGAEALQLNDVRIVASTAFAGPAGAITVSGARVAAPYVITAIGAAETMFQALKIPGGVVDTIAARQGASIGIQQRQEVKIASLRPAPRFTYASPS
jgi:uncharacterized protein YlxW (UPF0749 family)